MSSCSIEMTADKNEYLANPDGLVWFNKVISVTKNL